MLRVDDQTCVITRQQESAALISCPTQLSLSRHLERSHCSPVSPAEFHQIPRTDGGRVRGPSVLLHPACSPAATPLVNPAGKKSCNCLSGCQIYRLPGGVFTFLNVWIYTAGLLPDVNPAVGLQREGGIINCAFITPPHVIKRQ